MEAELLGVGATKAAAEALCTLFASYTQALPYVAPRPQRTNGFKASVWEEFYSLKYKRYYYCNREDGSSGWDCPKPLILEESMLDVSLYGLDIKKAFALVQTVHALVDSNVNEQPDLLWECVGILAKLVGNIVQCGNALDKYRSVKTDNPKIRSKVLMVGGAAALLREAGFRQSNDAFTFPSPSPSSSSSGTDTPSSSSSCPELKAASAVGAKLNQLLERKGFTGTAVPHDDTGASPSTSSNSKWAGTPGFRYQKEIHCCSVCDQPINDGSERALTRSHDSPKGQFRYQCDQCVTFMMCEGCWDKHFGGDHLHEPSHTFRTHHPVTSQHFMYQQESDSNPWGQFLGGGGGVGRARDRLRDRTGL